MTTKPVSQGQNPNVTLGTGGVQGAGRALPLPKVGETKAKGGESKSSVDVNISDAARDRTEAMAKATDIARNTPDIREDKVADIKARIAAGTYKVDSGAIADGMLREAIKEHLATEGR